MNPVFQYTRYYYYFSVFWLHRIVNSDKVFDWSLEPLINADITWLLIISHMLVSDWLTPVQVFAVFMLRIVLLMNEWAFKTLVDRTVILLSFPYWIFLFWTRFNFFSIFLELPRRIQELACASQEPLASQRVEQRTSSHSLTCLHVPQNDYTARLVTGVG